jgi:hypothetical protein
MSSRKDQRVIVPHRSTEMYSRMLKKSASFVLVSFRGSTYRSVRLTSSLTAAALDGHFEHPASRHFGIAIRKITVDFEVFRSLL